MKDSQIKNIFIKYLKETPVKIIDSSNGYDQIVKIIITKDNKYVFKYPRIEKEIIQNQVFASKKWLDIGIPVPKVLYHNKDFLIESFISGIQLDRLKATKKQKQTIYFQLGKLIKKMHSIKTKGFGQFEGQNKGRYKKLEDYEKWTKNKLEFTIEFIKEHKLLSIKELALLEDYIKKNVKLSKKINYVLTHQDLCEEHIYINNGKISGIIDLGDIKSDDPMSDFRRIAKEKSNQKFLPHVIKGYAGANKQRINLHRFLLIMYLIPKLYNRNKLKRLKFFINKLNKILK